MFNIANLLYQKWEDAWNNDDITLTEFWDMVCEDYNLIYSDLKALGIEPTHRIYKQIETHYQYWRKLTLLADKESMQEHFDEQNIDNLVDEIRDREMLK